MAMVVDGFKGHGLEIVKIKRLSTRGDSLGPT